MVVVTTLFLLVLAIIQRVTWFAYDFEVKVVGTCSAVAYLFTYYTGFVRERTYVGWMRWPTRFVYLGTCLVLIAAFVPQTQPYVIYVFDQLGGFIEWAREFFTPAPVSCLDRNPRPMLQSSPLW